MTNTILLVAGGSGQRMNSSTPKQFLLLNGKPLLLHTLERFYAHPLVKDIIVVLPASQTAAWEKILSDYRSSLPHRIAEGGASRYESVRNGLQLVKSAGIVGVHDGVRPLVSHALITRCLEGAKEFGNAIPVVTVPESIRQVSGNDRSAAVDRSTFRLVQTPQCFDTSYIDSCYGGPELPVFTDDASVLEAAGKKIHLVEGDRWNIKITFPEDLIAAAALLSGVQ